MDAFDTQYTYKNDTPFNKIQHLIDRRHGWKAETAKQSIIRTQRMWTKDPFWRERVNVRNFREVEKVRRKGVACGVREEGE